MALLLLRTNTWLLKFNKVNKLFIFLQHSAQKTNKIKKLRLHAQYKEQHRIINYTIEARYFGYIISSLLRAMMHEATSLQFRMCTVFECIADPLTHRAVAVYNARQTLWQ